ncbi:MAG: NADH-quinone oxidoreductase subunit NuoH [Anaerolineaceae bacterium]
MNLIDFLRDPIIAISDWITNLFSNWGMATDWATFFLYLIGAAVLGISALLMTLFFIWAERKIIGRLQDRVGPNQIGPWGIFQSVADMVKIFIKEHIIPTGVDPIPYHLAPIVLVASVLMVWAIVPFSNTVYGSNLNVAVIFLLAVGGLGEVGVMMAGWGSNNKYALISAFRASAQMISYEVPMAIILLIPVLLSSSMSMNDIVNAQNIPYILVLPFGALIFFIASIAENGRAPFDLAEAESELVAGFNIEYSGLKFGMFYVADFLRAFTSALIFSTLFLGGWKGPGAEAIPVLGAFYLIAKSLIIWFLGVWIRGSFPRYRIDQMMNINWKFLTPISLVLFMLVILFSKLVEPVGQNMQYLVILIINLGLFFLSFRILNNQNKKKVVAEVGSRTRPVAKPDNLFSKDVSRG